MSQLRRMKAISEVDLMGYYDSVKDSVKDSGKDSDDEGSGGNFDTLVEAAQEDQDEEEQGDDTPIEILDENGLRKESESRDRSQEKKQSGERRQKRTNSSEQERTDKDRNVSTGNDMSEIEDKLDRIIEQNSRMIDILESFGS